MDPAAIAYWLRNDAATGDCLTAFEHLPASEATYADWPAGLDARLAEGLRRRGIPRLYTHQAAAAEAALRGENVVVVTPTASGKTLCYNLPVLQAILDDPGARALYLFPTKALSQDQVAELQGVVSDLEVDIKTHTYDGDTPQSARKAIRMAGHIVVTNPDMLHTAILPHHTKWLKLFENLRYVVIDELHTYRGVFGSHLANLIRRLRRVCRFYGADPRFICCSATIANPAELAQALLEAPVTAITENGAPRGDRYLLLYNPPVVNKQLGIRRSALAAAEELTATFLANGVKTILFARSRLSVEILLTGLRQELARRHRDPQMVHGYRSGYLPAQRRSIEVGLRNGTVKGVVTTNALELGIDIGGLDACVVCGYPGTVASTWQQMGRAGRGATASVAVLVATSSPLDQYMVGHPAYFLSRPPESGLINPDNLLIVLSHLKCAAFELPFGEGESFGATPGAASSTAELLAYLEEEGVVHHVAGTWHWSADVFPAEAISLRSASADNVIIVERAPAARVIGEVDRITAPTMVYQGAIYLHQGVQYQVEELDLPNNKAYVTRCDVDYYTDANLAVSLKVLDVFAERAAGVDAAAHGEVALSFLATMYKKIRFETRENVGAGDIHLPEDTLHTTAYWLALGSDTTRGMDRDRLQEGLLGLANVVVAVAPLFLMCDPRDVGVVAEARSPFTGLPTIYLYDNYPGGVGFSPRLYDLHEALLHAAGELIGACPCDTGCPSCVGPAAGAGKAIAQQLVQRSLSPLAERAG
ncbi:MAG: ATP-dependent helicase MrfA [Chloroflexota bacterium]